MLFQNKRLCYPIRRFFNIFITFMMHPKGVYPNTWIYISNQAAIAMWFSLSWHVLERLDSQNLFWLLKFGALFQSWRRCCLHPCLTAGQDSPLPTSLFSSLRIPWEMVVFMWSWGMLRSKSLIRNKGSWEKNRLDIRKKLFRRSLPSTDTSCPGKWWNRHLSRDLKDV